MGGNFAELTTQPAAAPEPTTPFEAYVISSLKHANAFEEHVITALKRASAFEEHVIAALKGASLFEEYVIKSLTTLTTKVENLERNTADIIETQAFLVSETVTHDELDEKLAEFGKDLKDEITTDLKTHVSVECEKVREDVMRLVKKSDGRTDDVVVTLERKKIISRSECVSMLNTSPFAV